MDMKKIKSFILAAVLFQLTLPVFSQVEECTIGVASGIATQDGRPMVWKTRDYIQEPDNLVRYNNSMDYPFIYVVGAGSTSARMGVSEHGLAIVNSTSSDLPDGSDSGLLNGELIKEGLGTCLTIEEFQDLLDETNSIGRRTNGNFAIIDSTGAAALFEVGEQWYWRFDATDDPKGYILRTNFAVNGGGSTGKERLIRSVKLVNDFYSGDSLNHKSILRYQMRDFSDLSSDPFPIPFDGGYASKPHGYIETNWSICRNTSVSATVITGILPGEFPELSTMWTILGQPATSIALPYWPIGFPPHHADGVITSLLCDVSLQIKEQLFDYASDADWIDTYKLLNGNGGGLWTKTFPYEDTVLNEVEALLTNWRELDDLPVSVMKSVEDSLAENTYNYLQTCLSYVLADPPVTANLNANLLVFPNPFESETMLNYQLSHRSDVRIDIYTMTGVLIQSIVCYDQTPGKHFQRLSLDLPSASGIMILKLTVNDRSQTLKLIKRPE